MIFTKDMQQSVPCTNKDKWATPNYIFKPLNEKYNFQLDPCCDIKTAKCETYFTELDNGLTKNWKGLTSFVNPPYSRNNINKWVEKCYNEHLLGSTVVALLPVSTSSSWFHDYILGKAEIYFYRGRIKFEGATHTAPFSSMLAIYSK